MNVTVTDWADDTWEVPRVVWKVFQSVVKNGQCQVYPMLYCGERWVVEIDDCGEVWLGHNQGYLFWPSTKAVNLMNSAVR